MRTTFWNCEVQKNWDGTLREEMLDRNILCYGKPGSGKTEKVAKPFIRHAMERGNSILFVPNQGDEHYADIFALAEENGYTVRDMEAKYCSDYDMDEINQLGDLTMGILLKPRTMLRVRMDASKKFQYNSVLASLYGLLQSEKDGEIDDERNISVLLEDSNWELFVPEALGMSGVINFCITMDSQRLGIPDLKVNYAKYVLWYLRNKAEQYDDDQGAFLAELGQAVNNQDHTLAQAILNENIQLGTYDARLPFFVKSDNCKVSVVRALKEKEEKVPDLATEFAQTQTPVAVRRFLASVQTVICTGVAGLIPDEHRAFLQACVLSAGISPPGGKFLVTELTAPGQPLPRSVFPKTVLTARGRPVEECLACEYHAGRCVIERNGVPFFYAAYNGDLVPMTFRHCSDALAWLELYHTQMGWGWPEPVEMDACSLRYLLPTRNEKGEHDEIIISYVQEADVSSYVDQALLILMEVEEYLRDPALQVKVPGLERKKEAANISLQKVATHVCRNIKQVQKCASAELPMDEDTKEPVASMIEEYQWRPYQKVIVPEVVAEPEQAMEILPEKRILFLGGHANMVKKLRQIFPGWDFLTDDELGSWTGGECEVIFFWSKHCSHSLQHYVDVRKSKDTPYIYVTATNIDRLISEMALKYKSYKSKLTVKTA